MNMDDCTIPSRLQYSHGKSTLLSHLEHPLYRISDEFYESQKSGNVKNLMNGSIGGTDKNEYLTIQDPFHSRNYEDSANVGDGLTCDLSLIEESNELIFSEVDEICESLSKYNVLSTESSVCGTDKSVSEVPTEDNVPSLETRLEGFNKCFQDSDGDTILHIAVAQENLSVLKRLSYMDFFPTILDMKDNFYNTALHLATIMRNRVMTNFLVQAGADVILRNSEGQNCFHIACSNGDQDIFRILLYGTSNLSQEQLISLLHQMDGDGFTPFHLTVASGNGNLMEDLLGVGVCCDIQEARSGKTALHHAVESGNLELIAFLISLGLSPFVKTFGGLTPLALAKKMGSSEMQNILLEGNTF